MSLSPAWSIDVVDEPTGFKLFDSAGILGVLFNEQNSGENRVLLFNTNDGSELSTFETRQNLVPRQMTYDDRVDLLFLSTEQSVYAFDPVSKGTIWHQPAKRCIAASKDIVVLSSNANLWGCDPETGTILWRITLPFGHASNSAEFVSNMLLIKFDSALGEDIIAIDIKSGTERWLRHSERGEWNEYKILDRNVFGFLRDDGYVIKLNSQTGVEQSRYECEGINDWTYSSDTVFIYTSSEILAIDIKTGNELWRQNSHSYYEHFFAFSDDIYGCIRDKNWKFAKIDCNTGRISWDFIIHVKDVVSDTSSDAIYVATKYSKTGDTARALYKIHQKTGNIHWMTELDYGSLEENHTIVEIDAKNDPIVCRTEDAYSQIDEEVLYAVSKTDGTQQWSRALKGKYQKIITATHEYLVIGGSSPEVVSRKSGTSKLDLNEHNYTCSEEALFSMDGTTISAYALSSNPPILDAESPADSTQTKVFEADEEHEMTQTNVYENESKTVSGSTTTPPRFCPSCGTGLKEYDNPAFCPRCGHQL